MSTATAPMLSARQLVQSMPDPFREAVLAELLRDPDSPLPAADRVYFSLAPEIRAELMKPYLDLDLDDTLAEEELADLTRPTQRRASSALQAWRSE